MLGKAINHSLTHNKSRFFMENSTPTKDQVHDLIKRGCKGGELAKAVGAYFKANFQKVTPAVEAIQDKGEDIVEFAQKLFNPVETPGAIPTLGQGVGTGPGILTPPRATQLQI